MESTNESRYEARFERIESALENLANGQQQMLTTQILLTEKVTAIAASQVEQIEFTKKITEAQIGLTKAQVALTQSQAALMAEQAKAEMASQETQGKLDALIQMWDDWIREWRAREGDGPPIQ